MFRDHRGSTNVIPGDDRPEKKHKRPLIRTLEPRMVFDAAAAVAVHQGPPVATPEPAHESPNHSIEPTSRHVTAAEIVPGLKVETSLPLEADPPVAAAGHQAILNHNGDLADAVSDISKPSFDGAGSENHDPSITPNTDRGLELPNASRAAIIGMLDKLAPEVSPNAAAGSSTSPAHPPETLHLPSSTSLDRPADKPTDMEDGRSPETSVSQERPSAALVAPSDGSKAGTQAAAQDHGASPIYDERVKANAAENPVFDTHFGETSDRAITEQRINGEAKAAGEVYFIVDNVQDWQQVVASMEGSTRVYVLDSSKDGVEQIAAILKGEQNIRAIHLISHGSEGSLNLGTAVLDSQSMQGKYHDELTAVGQALSDQADILIYGCDFASGADGLQAAVILGGITKADIAASTDRTGAAARGGDWDLEQKTGAIETASFSDAGYQGLLAPPTVDLDGSLGSTGNSAVSYSENGAAVPIVANGALGATVVDADNDLVRLTIVADAVPNGDAEHLAFGGVSVGLGSDSTNTVTVGATTYLIAYSAATRTFVITNNAGGTIPSGGDTNALVRSITYANSSDDPTFGGTDGDRIFSFTATDLTATTSAVSTATVSITAVNDAPVNTLPASGWTTNEDQSVPLSGLQIADPDAGTGSITVSLSVPAGTITATSSGGVAVGGTATNLTLTGTVADLNAYLASASTPTYTPAADAAVDVTLTMTTSDNGNSGGPAGTDVDTATISIAAVNDAPVGANDAAVANEDTIASGNVLENDTDADGDTLVVTQFVVNGTTFNAGQTATITGVGTLVIGSDGFYTFTPVPNYNGPVPVATYTLSDGTLTATAALAIAITPVNDPPVDGNETNTVAEDTTLTVADGAAGDLLNNATDVDSATLTISTFSVAGQGGPFVVGTGYAIAGVGTITINANGSYSFAPTANFVGTIPLITYTVSDGAGGTDTSTLTLTMVAANDAPAGTNNTVTITEDTAYAFSAGSFGFSDPNDTPANAFQAVIITTLPPPSEGTLLLNGVAVTPGQTIAVADIPNLVFQPTANVNGTSVGSFTFQVVDDGGTANNGLDTDQTPNTFAFNITAVNDAPVATDDTVTTPEDTTLTGNVLANDTDVDGDTLTITSFSALNVTAIPGQTGTIPGVGQITMNADGSYTFIPVANFSGPVPVITYTVSDGKGGTDTATLNIEVISVNDPPVDGNETNAVTEDTTLTVADGGSGDLLNNSSDLDGDPLTITSYTIPGVNGGNPITAGTATLIPGVGTITINANGSYSFVPVANYDGSVPVITYTVSDGTDTDTSTLTLTMTPVNDAPVAVDDAAATPENTPVSGNVLGNDTDVDDTALTVTFFTINGTTYGAGTTVPIPGVGTMLINTDGSYTFTPAPSYDGPVPPVTYTVSDGELTDTAVLQITITPLNDPPIADDETGTTPEDTTLTVPASSGLLAGDTDVDGDPLAVTEFTVAGDPTVYSPGDTATIAGVGDLTINADGSYSFVPAPNYNGPVPVATYTVSDGNGGTDQGTLTLNVTPVNDPPVAVDDTGTTPEDTSLSGNVLTNDSDPDTGDTLTVVGFSVNGNSFIAGATTTLPQGTITINADGSYVLVPAANYTGPVPVITYVVVDESGATTTATLALNVTPVNDPPVAIDDNAATQQDTPLSGNVINNDSDVDGDTIIVTEFTVDGNTYPAGTPATIPGVGTITVNPDGSYIFVPVPSFSGPVPPIDYDISDGNGGTDEGTLNIDVLPDGDPVVGANDDVATTPEDTTLTGNVVTNDISPTADPISVVNFTVAGDPTIYTAGQTANIAGVGTLTINLTGGYTFTPAPNYFGPVPLVTYTATNGTVSDTATLTITVTPVNDLPVAVNDTGTTPEDTTLAGNVLSNDTDVEGMLTVTQFSVNGITATAGQTGTIPNVGQITVNANGTYTFVPAANFNGPVPVVTYTVVDGSGATATATLTITVTPVNDAPAAVNDTGTTPEDTTLNGSVLTNDTDVEGATLAVTRFEVGSTVYTAGQTATIVGVGVLTINADGSYTFVPALNYNGPVPVTTYTVTDGATTATATLTITVTPVNDAPVANDDTNILAEDTTLTVPAGSGLLSNDADVDNASLTVDGFQVGGILFGAGTTAFIPGVGQLTIYADGSYTFTPAANFNGTVPPVTYRISDGSGSTDTAVLTITVTPVNDAPVDGNETNTVVEDTTLTIVDGAAGDLLNNATDIDGIDTLTITGYSIPGINGGNSIAAGTATLIPGVGTITINANGSYAFTPAADYTGAVPIITYTVSDNAGGTDTSTLTLTITPVNDPPVAVNDIVSTPEDTPLTGNVLGNDVDVDGDTLTVNLYQVVGFGGFLPGAPANIPGVGTLTIYADGSYTFVPVANYNGSVPVATYTIVDASGIQATADLIITVTPVNDPPVDGDETNTVTEDTTLTVPVASGLLANASDIDGGPLSITGYTVAGIAGTVGSPVAIANVGTITINADGSYSFVPEPNYSGAIPVITYTVSDGAGGSDTSTLTLTMIPVNDPPVDGDETNTVIEDTTLTVPAAGGLLVNASDIDGGPLTISGYTIAGVAGPQPVGSPMAITGVGTITINADGSYSFAPAANYTGAIPVITYTVSDGVGGSDTSTLMLTMVPVNDPPVDGDETNTVTEDTTLTVNDGATGDLLNNATDVEGDPLTITGYTIAGLIGPRPVGVPVSIAGVGTITINANGSYSFVPAANYSGAIPLITYTVSDGAGGSDTSTLTLTMVPVNDPPVDGDETNTVIEDTTLTVPAAGGLLVNAGDIDGGPLTISGYTIAGVAGPQPVGVPVAITGVGTITINPDGSYSFAPAANYTGAIPAITYTVSDGAGGTDTSTLTLTMIPVNDPPVDGNETNTVTEDTTLTVTDGATGDLLNNATDVEGDPLTITGYTIAGLIGPRPVGVPVPIAGVGTITINANGSYSFVPEPNYSGAIPVITYNVSDGADGTDTSTLTLTITPVNDAPAGSDNTVTLNEDATYTFAPGDFGFTDPNDAPANALQAVIITTLPPATEGTLLLSGAPVTAGQIITFAQIPSLTFQPAADVNGNGIGAFTFQVVDDGGTANGGVDTDQSPNHFAFNIAAVNDPPVDGNESNSVIEDTTLTVPAGSGLLANTTDVDGGPPSVSSFTVAGQGGPFTVGSGYLIGGVGTVTINADGSYSFAPAADYAGAIPVITYTVSDGAGGSDTSTLTLTMIPVNDPPIDGNETNSVVEDTTLTVSAASGLLANTTDVDGGPPSVSAFAIAGETGPFVIGSAYLIDGVGSLTINADGSYSFVPVADYDGPVPVTTYTVSDGAGGTDTSTLTLMMVPVNDPPIANPDIGVTPEDTTLTGNVLANDTDIDGGPLRVTQFTVDGTTYITGQTATVTGVGTLTIHLNGGYTFVPALDYNGPVPLATYIVSDGAGGTDSAVLAISITPVNDPPAGTDIPNQVSLDANAVTPVDVSDHFSDVDGNVLTYAASGLPAGLSIDPASGLITGTLPNDASQQSPYTVVVTATDPSGASTTETFRWIVINPPPIAEGDIVSGPEDTILTGTVISNDNDPDGDPISISQFVVGGNTYLAGQTATLDGVGTLMISADGSYTFVPALNFNGTVPTVTYTLADDNGGTDTATLNITITPVNDSPVLVDDHASGNEDTTISGNVLDNDSDPDNDPLVVTGFSVDGDPANYLPGETAAIAGVGTITLQSDGSFTFVPAPNYDGPVPVILYSASDGEGGEGQARLFITIQPVDDFVPRHNDDVPDLPVGPDFDYNPENVDGAVVEAVRGLDGLNDLADLSGLSVDAVVSNHFEPQLKFALTTFLGGSSTFVIERSGAGDEKIRIDSVKHSGVIYLQVLEEHQGGGESDILSYRLHGQDGAPSPSWLRQLGPRSFAGNPDAGSGAVDLILSVVQRDGQVIDYAIRLDSFSGHLSQVRGPEDHGFEPRLAPMFTEQMLAGARERDINALERALGFR